ncbi:unnamed protein product [Phytophthora lilii]|uniref:Unnamed protein product n=1 Tax=Phytophthora lilii TaxID=2077276 RepID=A0A9W6XBG7_9STRA|nr:unnamed protein product [Phytophthora lilii]
MANAAESLGVRLKRKVRSAETKLFEWRPCSCTIVARDGKLLLQLQTPPRDEESNDEAEDSETVVIDLATQLLNVVPKKNKARCDLEYYAPVATMSGEVLKEELMAPSAVHCQQWIAQVRRIQQQAHQQRRPTSSTSTRSGASPVAPLPSPLSIQNGLKASEHGRIPNVNDTTAAPSSVQSTTIQEPSPVRRQTSCEISRSDLGHSEPPPSPCQQSVSKQRSASSSMSSSANSFTLPSSLAAVATAASCRIRERCDVVQTTIDNSELDRTIDSSSNSPVPTFDPVPRSDAVQSLVSSLSSASTAAPSVLTRPRGSMGHISSPRYSSSSSESEMPHSLRRRSRRSRPLPYDDRYFEVNGNNDQDSDYEHEPCDYPRRSFRRSSDVSYDRHTSRSQDASNVKNAASSSSRGSPPYRLSSRTRGFSGWLPREANKQGYETEGESSQAELHILQRVEAALRALELENAQAKARERELVQEIQTLRDAARVAAAERKHTEQEYRHARREVDSWRRAAQSAEAAATQLQEQLGIAREENQLLAGEKLRLKRQNSELLTQVHRLDSLVYGRF